jgi:quercetin dioxygenase-like cupin family protein
MCTMKMVIIGGTILRVRQPHRGRGDRWYGIPKIPTAGLVASLLCAIGSPLTAQQAVVTPLMTKALPDVPGKEALMLMVEYPPGSSDPVHRHNADALVYVLEGSIVMQVKGGKPVTLTPGQTFYEGPDDVHVVGRNASTTKPARFVVVLVKKQGAPPVVPAEK